MIYRKLIKNLKLRPKMPIGLLAWKVGMPEHSVAEALEKLARINMVKIEGDQVILQNPDTVPTMERFCEIFG
jgi:hypothetical protein